MPVVIAFKFSQEELPKYYLPGTLDEEEVKEQDFYVAPREGSEDVGFVAALEHWSRHQVRPDRPLPVLLRRATPDEIERWWEIKALERRALLTCKEKVTEHNLPMKVSTVRYETKNNKLAFLFTSDKRVDFRALVRDLAALLRCRIELWQIGVREEARVQDGYGVCGLRTCCSAWIKDFKPINLKMAKEQDIDLPPSKLTGQCGRLLCCLSYEVDAYRELAREALPKGTTLIHSKGRGVVVDRNLIRRTYLVADEHSVMSTISAKDIVEFSYPDQMKKMGKKMLAELTELHQRAINEVSETRIEGDEDVPGTAVATTSPGVFTRIEDENGEDAAVRDDTPVPPTPPPRRPEDTGDSGKERSETAEARRDGGPDRQPQERVAESRGEGAQDERTSERQRSGRRHRGGRHSRGSRPDRRPREETRSSEQGREAGGHEEAQKRGGEDREGRGQSSRPRRRGRGGRRGQRPPRTDGGGQSSRS